MNPNNPLPFTEEREPATEEQWDRVTYALFLETPSDPDVIGRFLCWLCYRALENKTTAAFNWMETAIKACNQFIPLIVNEKRKHTRARWLVSTYLAMAYCKIELGQNPINELGAINSLELIIDCPTSSINICRGLILMAGYFGKMKALVNAQQAITDCHTRFRLAAGIIQFTGGHICVGTELVNLAKTVAISIYMQSHLGMKIEGIAAKRQDILAIETYWFFQNALNKVLPESIL